MFKVKVKRLKSKVQGLKTRFKVQGSMFKVEVKRLKSKVQGLKNKFKV